MIIDRDAGGLVVHVMMTEEEIAEKSLRIGVHNADAVVWGPVYRTHLRGVPRNRIESNRIESSD